MITKMNMKAYIAEHGIAAALKAANAYPTKFNMTETEVATKIDLISYIMTLPREMVEQVATTLNAARAVDTAGIWGAK